MNNSVPILIIIHGLPGSGKSSLAQGISKKLNIPWFGKDQFKEMIIENLAITDQALAKKSGAVATDILHFVGESLLAKNSSVILENYWHKDFAISRFNNFLLNHPVLVIQVICQLNGEELVKRFSSRVTSNNKMVHGFNTLDPSLQDLIKKGEINPLDITKCHNVFIDTMNSLEECIRVAVEKISKLV